MKIHSQQTIQNKFASNPRRWAIINAAIVLVLSLFVWRQAGQWYQATLLTNQRSEIEDNLIPYGNALTSVLNRRFTLLEGLAVFVKVAPTDADLRNKFTPFASGLYTGKQDVRAVQIFPKEGPVLVYPIEGNEATIGRTLNDLINDDRPDVRADIQRALQTRQIAISGPYELRQGGLGMVARLAIYQEDTLLGMAVIVLDIPSLLKASGLDNPQPRIRLALKDSSAQILTGPESVFSDNPVTYTIVLPDGEWELAAMPSNGWTESIQNSLRIFQWTGLLIIALATSLAYLITNRQAHLTLAIQERTAALTASIAKREQANEALRESERRLREMLENVELVAVLLDLEGRVIFCNEFLLQISGYTRDEVMGHDWFAQFVPNVRADVKETFLQGLKRGEIAAHYENPIRTKSGQERLIRFSNTIMRDPQGKAIGTTSLGEDITEHKQVENALRESEEKFSTAFQDSPIAMAILTDDGKFVNINGSFCKLVGYSREEVIGRNIIDLGLVSAEDREKLVAAIVSAGGSAINAEVKFYIRDGSFRDILYSTSAISLHGIPHRLSTGIDITERKQAEQSMRESEQLFSKIFTDSPIAISMVELPGGKNINVNDAWCKLTGFSKEEAIGHATDELKIFDPEERSKLIKEFSNQGYSRLVESEITTKSGGKKSILISSEAITINERQLILTSAMDITERKQAGQALLESEERFRIAFEQAAVGIAHVDTNGRWLRVNQRLCDIVGYTRNELLSELTFQDITHRDDLQNQLNYVHQMLTGEIKTYAMEKRYIRKDRSIVWVNLTVSLVRAASGEPKYFISIVEDITERKWMELELQKRFNELNTIYQSAQSLQKLVSADEFSIEILHTLERISGYEYGAVLILDEASGRLIPFAITEQGRGEAFGAQDKEYILSHAPQAGRGITGWVAEHGQSALVNDVTQDPRYYGLREDICSELCVPLWNGGKVYGVLNIESIRPNAYSLDDQHLLETAAAQIAIAIQNARLLESERQAYRMAETLRAANLALTKNLNLNSVFETMLEYLKLLVPYDSANVMLFEDEFHIRVVKTHGYEQWTDSELTQKVIFDWRAAPVFENMIKSKSSLLIPDTSQYPGWLRPPGTEHVMSWIGIPLISGGVIIGFYSIDKREPDYFTKDHQHQAETLAGQAAVAIQNARLLEETRQSRDRLAELSRKIVHMHEEESRAIGRELHDQIGQMLTALKLTIEIAPQMPPESAQKKITHAQEIITELLERVSNLTLELRPPMLDDFGLIPALVWHINRFQEQSGIQIEFKHYDLEGRRFKAELETTAYRIVQEALTNTARHAQATRIRVDLRVNMDELNMQIEDNGHGFNAEQALAEKRSSGLRGMRERAILMGGAFRIESAPGKGAKNIIQLPLTEKTE